MLKFSGEKMGKEKIVIALGGNALLGKGEEMNDDVQYHNAANAFGQLTTILRDYQAVITHGNGTQVGPIYQSLEITRKDTSDRTKDKLISDSVKMSVDYIGEILRNAYSEVNAKENIGKIPVVVPTRVLVDPEDLAFEKPTKPIGKVYSENAALELMKQGWVLRQTIAGWRRVVSSPIPVEIIDIDAIEALLEAKDDKGRYKFLPIAAGGGGIPVIEKEGGVLEDIEGVVDKDYASALLAILIQANTLLILTDVPYVYRNFRKSNQEKIEEMCINEAEQYLQEGHFEPGTMEPKVRAAILAVTNGVDRAIIGSLPNAGEAFFNDKGTVIKSCLRR